MIDFQQIRRDVDLVALIGQRIALQPRGRRWWGRCPFHDDRHPSLDVSPAHQVWRCWVCGVGGDAVDWVRLTENCSTVEALHRLSGPQTLPPAPPAGLDPYPLAPRALRHHAFRTLLQTAGLSAAHQAALAARGLPDPAIAAAGYASLPPGSRTALLAAMQAAVPDLRGIPGVAHRPDRNQWRLYGAPGLLIPVRDRRGQIQACQIRADGGGTRYQWLTSAPHAAAWTGTSPGTPFHVAGHRRISRAATWWVTEGPLKADVAAWCLRRPVIGIPGVALWPRVGRVLAAWQPAAVVLALDQDAAPATRARVADAQHRLGALLAGAGLRVYVATWPEGPKGLDDALTARAPLQIRRWRPDARPGPGMAEPGGLR